MSNPPTLMHGNDGDLYDLEFTTDLGSIILGTVLKEVSDTLTFKSDAFNGTINNLNFKASYGKAHDFSSGISVPLCNPTFRFKPSISFSGGIKAQGLGDSVIPLIESMEFRENSLSQPDDIGLATETVRYSFDANINLDQADFRFNSRFNIKGGLYTGCGSIPGSWALPSAATSISKDIVFNNQKLKTPATHPVSFTLALTIPSFNGSQEQLTKSNNGVSYSSKSFPEISGIKIENLKLNNLFSSIIDNNPFIGNTVQSVAVQAINNTRVSSGLLAGVAGLFLKPIIEVGLKSFSGPISNKIKDIAIPIIKDKFNGNEGSIQTTVNETLESKEFKESAAFKNLASSFKDQITEKTWRSSEYPMEKSSLLNTLGASSLGPNQNSTPANTEPNSLVGTRKQDKLIGSEGDDTLIGMERGDLLIGGEGKDIFKYTSPKHSRAKRNRLDLINDFSRKQGDRIDVSILHDNLSFISDSEFSNKAGEIRVQNGLISIDLTGNGASNFDVLVNTILNIKNNDLILN